MNTSEFRAKIEALQMRQNQLAGLLGVTSRAVGMWINGEREIPGPVIAYLNLLASLPKALRVKEIERLEKEKEMLEGMYQVNYAGVAGFGNAVLIIKDGRIFGSDVGGASYDGVYEPTEKRGEVIMALTISVPPGMPMVQGIQTDHQGFSFQIAPQKFNLLNPDSVFSVATPVNGVNGVVNARIIKLRNLPN